MNIFKSFQYNIVRQWILLRMAATEFYFKQPYDVKEEYPILTSVLGFALAPIYMIFIFLYARTYGSLERFNVPLIILMFVVCFGIAYLIIRQVKNKPFIDQTIREYESMDLEARKKFYFFQKRIQGDIHLCTVTLDSIRFCISNNMLCCPTLVKSSTDF